MFVVSYSQANADHSGSVVFEQETMTDVCSVIESSFGLRLTTQTMMNLLSGVSIQVDNLDVWLTETL